VDLALKLNVLAVLAVFAFVGAILLGALWVRVSCGHCRISTPFFLHRRAQLLRCFVSWWALHDLSRL